MSCRKYFVAVFVCLLWACGATAQQQNWSFGFTASATSWNASFQPLQSPGWESAVHPAGLIDVQYKHVYLEVGGDPHRTGEASSTALGLRFNLLKKNRFTLYGQASLGGVLAPSFLEYCGSYEYNGDCHAGDKQPEYCWWWGTNVGAGVKVKVRKHLEMELLRIEYLNPYAIGPRWRFASGFRVPL